MLKDQLQIHCVQGSGDIGNWGSKLLRSSHSKPGSSTGIYVAVESVVLEKARRPPGILQNREMRLISNACFEFRSGMVGRIPPSTHFLDMSLVQRSSSLTLTATLPMGNVHGKMLGNQKQDPK